MLNCEIDFENQRRIFRNPIEQIETNKLSELPACFTRMEEASAKGHYLAGYLTYEAGYGFEPCLIEKNEFDLPVLSFGVYPRCQVSHQAVRPKRLTIRSDLNHSWPEYHANISRIREYIAAGDTYQITYCVKNKFTYEGAPYELYRSLLDFQPVPYPAYLGHPDYQILSLSPELFFHKRGTRIVTKPMKGTLLRDGSWHNDLFGARWLHRDPKNRAENIMITDLLRNDLGRICRSGSVRTVKLYEVAKYRTVYQMTSTIQGELNDAALPYYDLFKAIFPSGSVTGAPKIRAMKIIRELEPEERRIYTGAIGFITPEREMFFNVPIRTILLQAGRGEMGVGGGITHYSTPEGEWDECLVKSRFLTASL
ncbi:MAG: aminodeoxychorismate synthase component I [Candidatus Margulisbacteria bacterium]|nr:aminodeoxychorismate synthase component I [Candidatus Margulisiibacteriota bacterium]